MYLPLITCKLYSANQILPQPQKANHLVPETIKSVPFFAAFSCLFSDVNLFHLQFSRINLYFTWQTLLSKDKQLTLGSVNYGLLQTTTNICAMCNHPMGPYNDYHKSYSRTLPGSMFASPSSHLSSSHESKNPLTYTPNTFP